jgi:methanogenic corrinoid protein MtbC1
MVFDLYLSNHSAASILDDVIAEAFHSIGDRWSHGEAQVYQERRAVEICSRVLTQLRMALPSVTSSAPLAIGGTCSGDPYTLPTAMVDIALREAGWRAESLGTNLPAETLVAAINDLRPRLFWLSVSALLNVDELVAAFDQIMEAANRTGASVIVGGRSITLDLQKRMINARYCATFRQTAAFAQSTWRSAHRESQRS